VLIAKSVRVNGISLLLESPPVPSSYTEKRTQEYSLLLHVKEVIDCGPLTMMEGLDFYPGKDEDLSRKHKFKSRDGKIEGRSPGIHGHA
jgi:hypothetical protein